MTKKLAVVNYGKNNDKIPEHWPKEVKELEIHEVVPDGYAEFTIPAYEAYVATNQADYDHLQAQDDGYSSDGYSIDGYTMNLSDILPTAPYPGDTYIDIATYELYRWDGIRDKWLGARTVSLSGAKNTENVTNLYLHSLDGVATSATPLIIPAKMTLVAMTASGSKRQSWTAEVRKNHILVAGASLAVISSFSAHSFVTNVDFYEGDKLQIYMNGNGISRPRIDLYLVRRLQ